MDFLNAGSRGGRNEKSEIREVATTGKDPDPSRAIVFSPCTGPAGAPPARRRSTARRNAQRHVARASKSFDLSREHAFVVLSLAMLVSTLVSVVSAIAANARARPEIG